MHYFESLSDQAIEVWNLFVASNKARYTPIHSLAQNLGKFSISSMLAVGCNVIIKEHTKSAAMKQMDLMLSLFDQSQQVKADTL